MPDFIKQVGQSLLKRTGLYERARSSFLYDLYWKASDSILIEKREAEIDFFRRTLAGFRKGDLIFDVGANQGYKSDVFLRLGARVIAVDPDQENQEVLRQRFRHLRVRKKPVTIVGKAVSDRAGSETLWVDQAGSAKNTLNRKWVESLRQDEVRFGEKLEFAQQVSVETVTLDQLIEFCGRPFYIKIDVEGHEPQVLRGLSSPVPYVSFEVNLPEFFEEAVECVERLASLQSGSEFNYTVDCVGQMTLSQWLPASAFLESFRSCTAPSLEIFYRAAP